MAVRLPTLPVTDGVRGSACLVVIAWHAVLTVIPSDPTPTQQLFTLPLGVGARTVLTIFIVLSGLLLGRHWVVTEGASDWWRKTRVYLARRVWRIVPTYWVALAVVIACMVFLGLSEPGGTHWDTGLPLTWERVVTNVLLLTDLTMEVPLSHQFWTVPTELHLYLLGPVVALVLSRRHAIAVGFGVTAAIVLLMPGFHAPYFPFIFVVSFWVGLQRRSRTTSSVRETAGMLAPVFAASAVLLVLAVVAGTLPSSTGNYFVTDAIFGPLMLLWLAHIDFSGRQDRFADVLCHRVFIWLGHRSYSIYLAHAVVIELLWRFVFLPLGAEEGPGVILALVLVASVASVAAALPLFHFVEAPTTRKSAAVGRAARRAGGESGR